MKPMTPDEFKEKTKDIYNDDVYDNEAGHIKVDELTWDLLESLGYKDGVDVIRKMVFWYA